MNSPPYYYDYTNFADTINMPCNIHTANNATSLYIKRYLLQKIISTVEWKNLPKTWDINYLNYAIFYYGFCCVVNTNKFGVIPQYCTLGGYNVYYRPSFTIVANPLIPEITRLDIGLDTELLMLMPDYGSPMDIVNYYGDAIAVAMETQNVNIYNSRLAYIFQGKNKSAIKTLKTIFDKITRGEPGAFYDGANKGIDNDSWTLFNSDVGKNYIANDIELTISSLYDDFNTMIGIPNGNQDKKERMIVDEVHRNDVETMALIDLWMQTLKASIKKVNAMFALNIDVDKRYKGGDSIVSSIDKSL